MRAATVVLSTWVWSFEKIGKDLGKSKGHLERGNSDEKLQIDMIEI